MHFKDLFELLSFLHAKYQEKINLVNHGFTVIEYIILKIFKTFCFILWFYFM